MREHLVWLDKNWRTRGYANNNHLYVDHKNKTYDLVITYTNVSNAIEVKTKQDILNYICELNANGYIKSKECCAVN